jgi:hypothetical protein
VRFTLAAPSATDGPIAYAAGPARGRLRAGGSARVEVPVAARSAAVDVPVRIEGAGRENGVRVTLAVSDVRVAACGSPEPAPARG